MDSTSSCATLPVGRRGLVLALGALAAGLLLAAMALVTMQVEVPQVEVPAASAETTRTCGSAFDAVADRSGWQLWWAHDLDEPDEDVRAALVRTQQCPDAINRRIVLAAVLGTGAASAAACVMWMRRRRTQLPGDDVVGRIARLGRITSYVGVGLTVAGCGAIVLLLADAESTLFLYTDRPVVAVVGLIALIPAISLIVMGRALALLEGSDGRVPEPERTDA
ncbi:MAG TPA: hypothetical protein VLN74_14120 [Ilumatobacteraceae bacterium]|nr:hypothetical protein [Ilumatobacteraceae bacterium]